MVSPATKHQYQTWAKTKHKNCSGNFLSRPITLFWSRTLANWLNQQLVTLHKLHGLTVIIINHVCNCSIWQQVLLPCSLVNCCLFCYQCFHHILWMRMLWMTTNVRLVLVVPTPSKPHSLGLLIMWHSGGHKESWVTRTETLDAPSHRLHTLPFTCVTFAWLWATSDKVIRHGWSALCRLLFVSNIGVIMNLPRLVYIIIFGII